MDAPAGRADRGAGRQAARHQDRASPRAARARRRILPRIRAGGQSRGAVRHGRRGLDLQRPAQHHAQHQGDLRRAGRPQRGRAPPVRLLPGQVGHAGHRHHRRSGRRAPHLRRHEHARPAADAVRRVQGQGDRRHERGRRRRLRRALGRHHGPARRRRPACRGVLLLPAHGAHLQAGQRQADPGFSRRGAAAVSRGRNRHVVHRQGAGAVCRGMADA